MNKELDRIRHDAENIVYLLDEEHGIKWTALLLEQRCERLRLCFLNVAHLIQLQAMHSSAISTEVDKMQEFRREYEGRRVND